jgi:hypothetical protein
LAAPLSALRGAADFDRLLVRSDLDVGHLGGFDGHLDQFAAAGGCDGGGAGSFCGGLALLVDEDDLLIVGRPAHVSARQHLAAGIGEDCGGDKWLFAVDLQGGAAGSDFNGCQAGGRTVTLMESPTLGNLDTVAPISAVPSLAPKSSFVTGTTAATVLSLVDQATLSVTSLVC